MSALAAMDRAKTVGDCGAPEDCRVRHRTVVDASSTTEIFEVDESLAIMVRRSSIAEKLEFL